MVRKTNQILHQRLKKIIVKSGDYEKIVLATVGTDNGEDISIEIRRDERVVLDTYQKYVNYLNKYEVTHVILDIFKDEYKENSPIARVIDT